MKTFFERLFVHFDFMSHPASGSLNNKDVQRKKKTKRSGSSNILSPECCNMRGPLQKKQDYLRRTPAP